MKYLKIIILALGLAGCNTKKEATLHLQKQVDSLEKKLANTYKPGFGEFMSSIQVHHNKLWFAGLHQNWDLADFEIHEIMENIDDIQKFQKERKESQMIDMIRPSLDSVNAAIRNKNQVQFNSSYHILTNTCNNCHRATGFAFNIVKTPETVPFSNQEFTLQHPATGTNSSRHD